MPKRVPRSALDVVRLVLACDASVVPPVVTLTIVLVLNGGQLARDVAILCIVAFSAAWSIDRPTTRCGIAARAFGR